MESGASRIPVGNVTGCDDFEVLSFTHPYKDHVLEDLAFLVNATQYFDSELFLHSLQMPHLLEQDYL
jgi:hypothetical protein